MTKKYFIYNNCNIFCNTLSMSTTLISARLNNEVSNLLNQIAMKNNKSKSKIIEEAIRIYNENEIKKNIVYSYKNLWNNKESMELTEIWTQDFLLSYN